jgi:hypothetical protein
MVRLLAIVMLLLASTAHAETVALEDARLEAIVETLPHKPFEQELIILVIRGVYAVPITLGKLAPPGLDDFGWMQLGRDLWFDEMIDGRKLRVFERRMALFAKKRGKLPLGAFTHRLTLLDKQGKRFEHEVRSSPVAVEVARKPENIGWWLPAQSVDVSDGWDISPESLTFGASAKRTITLKAKGAPPEMLPPAPRMEGKGLIAFPDPEDRSVELMPEGPVSTVTWRWTVRMLSPDAAPLETEPLEWFDTVSRTPQKITFAPQRVALASNLTATPVAETNAWSATALPLGLLAGLLAGLAFILPGWRLKPWHDIILPFKPLVPRATANAIRAAARAQDAAAMWRAARRLDTPATHELSRTLFGRGEAANLTSLANRLLAEAKCRGRDKP